MKSESEVLHFFQNDLHEELEILEKYRCIKVSKIKKRLIFGTCWLIPAIICLCFSLPLLTFLFLFAAFLTFGYAFPVLQQMASKLQAEFKYKVLRPLLTFLFETYDYNPKQHIAKSVVSKSLLFTHPIEQVSGEDFMRFKLGKTGIMFSEVEVYKAGMVRSAIFKGIFLATTFNKYFSGSTLVLSRQEHSFLQISGWQLYQGFERIKLEDADFDNEFWVYGTDQVASRYVLSPSLMNRMLAYKNKTQRAMSFSFVDDHMYCCIPNYINLFEPALFNSFLDFELIRKNHEVIKLYTDLVEDLNLNLRIWSKI